MNIKAILYFIITPFVIWSLESINIEGMFKKNRIYQIRFLLLFIGLSISYLVVNYFYDFFINIKFI